MKANEDVVHLPMAITLVSINTVSHGYKEFGLNSQVIRRSLYKVQQKEEVMLLENLR